MPRLHLNRTGGARRAIAYVGVSERSTDDRERAQKRARRAKRKLVHEANLLAQSTDWKVAGERWGALRRRWKAAGSAGPDEERLWKSFKAASDQFHQRRAEHFAELAAAKQAMYDATAEDRRARQSEYVQRVEQRIRDHRETIGKLKAQRRELALRRKGLMPGWVGLELAEELDEQTERIDQYVIERERRLEEDMQRLARAMVGQDEVSVTDFYRRITTTKE